MDEKTIDEFRKKLTEVFDKFKAEDFERVHAKFFGGLVALESGYKKYFPEQAEKYLREFYGDEDEH